MNSRASAKRSFVQRVTNTGSLRGLSRTDAFTAYAIDRLLYRLGRSKHAPGFLLKGGILVANLTASPHRHTRDIDLLRQHGPPDPDQLREIFREIVVADSEDGLRFDPDDVRATLARRDVDDYDGVKVSIRSHLGATSVDIGVDIGFGDAVAPPSRLTALRPFLDESPPPRLHAYRAETVLAEKIEAILDKFPAIRHRLKDILDVAALTSSEVVDGASMLEALRATLLRRATAADIEVLDDLRREVRGKRWRADWATMVRDKRATSAGALHDAVERFDAFVRPLLSAIHRGGSFVIWRPGGPWSGSSRES